VQKRINILPSDSDAKRKPCLSRDVVVSAVASLSGESDFFPLLHAVLLNISLGALEDGLALLQAINLSLREQNKQ